LPCFRKPFVVVTTTTTTTMNRLLLISAAVLLTAAPATALVTPVVTADAAAVSSALTSGQDISSLTKSLKTVFTSEQIDKILPHRYPFALVDKVVEYTAGKSAVGIKCVTKVRSFACLPCRGSAAMFGSSMVDLSRKEISLFEKHQVVSRNALLLRMNNNRMKNSFKAIFPADPSCPV
jgi:hypothetical protein